MTINEQPHYLVKDLAQDIHVIHKIGYITTRLAEYFTCLLKSKDIVVFFIFFRSLNSFWLVFEVRSLGLKEVFHFLKEKSLPVSRWANGLNKYFGLLHFWEFISVNLELIFKLFHGRCKVSGFAFDIQAHPRQAFHCNDFFIEKRQDLLDKRPKLNDLGIAGG